MIRKVQFESQERRINQVLAALKENGINSIEEANEICEKAGIDPYQMCEDTQLICFENAKWAYVCGAAIAIKNGMDANEALKKFTGSYGRRTEDQGAVKAIDPRKE